ncbi:MAG: branched-chain amino acid ABC transporter substrate-binding protein [Chloroflexi bacterium]|nr:branched-chain amino acid ABC transporter substrate-binding protein [Chloroflexota bacterium]
MSNAPLTRRGFLRRTILAATGLTLAIPLIQACAPAPTPSPTTPPRPTAPPPTTAPAAASPTTPPRPTAAASPAASPAAAASPTVAPAVTTAPTGTIKVVSSLPRTGTSKAQTDTIVNAYKMALEEANMQVGSFKVTYEDWDDATAAAGKWTADKESENANKAVSDADVMVYHGTYNSGAASVAIPILNRANLVMISPANTWPGLTKPGTWEKGEPEKYYPSGKRNYCRVCPADDLQGAVAADWAKELGAKKIYILDDTELYGKGIADIFEKQAKAIGVTIAGHESIDTKAADYRTLATKIKGTTPDLVYFGGIEDNNAAKLWTDLRSTLGADVKLMGPDGLATQNFIKTAGQAGVGSYITFGGLPTDQYKGKAADWLKKYRDKYKGDPDVYAIYGYEAMLASLDAIKRAAKKDRDAIRAALMGTKDFEGVLGQKWSFTETGDTTVKTMAGMVIKGDKFEFAKLLG